MNTKNTYQLFKDPKTPSYQSTGKYKKVQSDDKEEDNKEYEEKSSDNIVETDKYIFFCNTGKLGSFFDSKFFINSQEYFCCSQYMAAEKARLFKDSSTLSLILNSNNALKCSELGKKVSGFDQKEWDKIKKDIVSECNKSKFQNNKNLRKYLLSFSNNKEFVLAESSDKIWGIGIGLKDVVDDCNQWKGLNLYGKMLTKLRNKFYYKQDIPCWFSCNLQLNDFNVKDQTYSIEGYINVFWKWPSSKYISNISGLLSEYLLGDDKDKDNDNDNDNDKENDKENENENENIESFKVGNKNDMDGYYNKIIKIKDLLDKTVKFNNKFPIDPRKVFYGKSLIELEHLNEPVLHYNTATGASHIQFNISATLFEKLELFSFPFDYQFLNIKFVWNSKFGKFKLIRPKINDNGQINSDNPIYDMLLDLPRGDGLQKYCKNYATISIKETLLSEITMETPWIYYNHNKNMHWLRLRVIRREGYTILTALFPIFLVVITIFCTFVQEDNDNALNYGITVLLTFAATQAVITGELPAISELLFADYYILFGYIVITLVILWSVFQYEDTEHHIHINNEIFIYFIVGLWMFITCLYVILWMKVRFCKKYSCCPCLGGARAEDKLRRLSSIFVCKYLYELTNNWKIRGKQEVNEYLNETNTNIKLQINTENIGEIGEGYVN